jgi:hypothetical protein
MGGDNGFLSLVTVPEVKTYADLKGRTLSVDALTTGYAFVLLDLLDRGGLSRSEFEVVKAGGVLQRWDSLKEKKQTGTMLITPFDIIAQSLGFNVLQRAIDVLRAHLQQMSPELAAKTYAVLAPPQGFTPKAKIDMEGVKRVLELRSRYGEPKKALSDPMKYHDGRYYNNATK